jgi:hypothetical protein
MRRALSATAALLRRDFQLVILNALGYAILLVAALAWLWIPDSHIWEFGLSVISGPAIVLIAVWLLIVTMERWNAGSDVRPVRLLRHLPGFLLWVLVAFGICSLIGMVNDRQYLIAGYLASRPSQSARHLFTYQRILSWVNIATMLATYYLLPILLVPLASETAAYGVKGIHWRRYGAVVGNGRLWLVQIAVVAVGVWLPVLLIGWIPGKRLGTQVLSVGLRLGFAYLLAVGAMLFVIAFVGVLLSGGDKSPEVTPQAEPVTPTPLAETT